MASDGVGPSDQAVSPEAKPRRVRKRPLILVIFGSGLAVFLVLAIVDGVRVSREVHAGRAAFARLFDDGFFADSRMAAASASGARHFEIGERIAVKSRWLGALARVPALGRPALWLRSATRSTAGLARYAAEAVARIEPRIQQFARSSERSSFLQTLEEEFGKLAGAAAAIHLPPTGGFLPPVDAAGRDLKRDLSRLRRTLENGVAGIRGLRSFLTGPSTYAVLAANNAEMRAGGMVLQVGILRSEGASIISGQFRSTGDLVLREPVTIPSELDALYGWLDPGIEWRNVGSSPNFPAIAPIYAAMAERSGLGRIDGAFQIDVLGVRGLLEIVGPVVVGGRTYDSANVERLILHDLYATFRRVQFERRHELSRLAVATIRALNERRWDPRRMLRALRSAALGRHLLAWSRRPIEQNAWKRMGIDGSLGRDGLMLTVQNHTGNKLDWFLRPSMDLRIEKRPGGWRRAHLRIRIDNPTPSGEPRYVAGNGALVPQGGHRALVVVYMPEWAVNVEMPGRMVALAGVDGQSHVIGTRLDIAQGASAVIQIAFSVPPGIHRIVLLPSARAAPVPVTEGAVRTNDKLPRILEI